MLSNQGHFRRIVIEAVRQDAMRAPYDQQDTAGDWFTESDGTLVIRATGTDLADPDTFLLALHELVEAYLCRHRGIDQALVDDFDARMSRHSAPGELGDHPGSPYRAEHRQAMLIEHLMANFLGIINYGTVA